MPVPEPVPDFEELTVVLMRWHIHGGNIPAETFPVIDAVLLERATRLAHVFRAADVLVERPDIRPTQTEFARDGAFEAVRAQWYSEYFSAAWLRGRLGWALSGSPGDQGGRMYAALRQRIAQDLQDIARRQDPEYQFARQKINRALRTKGCARACFEGGWWGARSELTVADLRLLPPAGKQEALRAKDGVKGSALASLRKQARADWWVEHWFERVPDHRVPLWLLVHTLLDIKLPEPAGAPATPATASAVELLRNIRHVVSDRDLRTICAHLRCGGALADALLLRQLLGDASTVVQRFADQLEAGLEDLESPSDAAHVVAAVFDLVLSP